MTNIVILGAGYAGMAAAVQLSARTRRTAGIEVTLVNASPHFTERMRLPVAATGGQVASLEIPALFDGRFEQGRVTGIELPTRTVRLSGNRRITFDILVYALGTVPDTAAVPGAVANAYTLDRPLILAARLRELESGTVVVGGNGLTGIETAAEIAESFPALRVVLAGRGEPAAWMNRKARTHLRGALARLGVECRTGTIAEVLPDAVRLGDEVLPAEVFVWAAGTRVGSPTGDLTVDERGRIVTGATLHSVSHPEVYAVGDAAAVRQRYGIMHGTCQGGMPTGVHAALSILRSLSGKEAAPFRFGYYHTPVSLGRHDGVVQFTHPDDTPRRISLTGRLAARYKETVTAAPWPTYRRMKKLPASGAFWPRGGR